MASPPLSKMTEGVILKSQSDLNRCAGKSLFLKPLGDFTFDFLPLSKVHPCPATRPGLSPSVMNVFLSLPLVLPAICLEAGAGPWLFQLCIHHINFPVFLEETLTSHRSSGDLASSHTSPWLRSSIFFFFSPSGGLLGHSSDIARLSNSEIAQRRGRAQGGGHMLHRGLFWEGFKWQISDLVTS